jgi:hypothetical protein
VAVVAKVANVAKVAVPLKEAVIVPALKLPEASRATMVLAVFALVALDVTVKVAALLWLAVKVWEPESPVPETARVKVPLLTLFAVVAVVARVARVARVAKVARVARVADVALPDRAPLKVVVVSTPVLGTKVIFVLDTFCAALPDVADTQVG